MAQPAHQLAHVSDLALVDQALQGMDKVSHGLTALRERFAGVVFDVSTKEGLAEARAARAAIREPRYEVERIRKAAKAPLLALGRRLDGEAQRITREILRLEEPIDQQIAAEEARVERERQEAIAREQARVAAIRKRIDEIRGVPLLAVGKNVAQLRALVRGLDELYEGHDFQEFAAEAQEVYAAAGTALSTALAERVSAEAAAEQLRRDREALAERQRAQEARQRELDEQERKNREAAAALEQLKTNPAPAYPVPEERMTPTLVEADDGPPPFDDTAPASDTAPAAWRPDADQIVTVIAMHFGVQKPEARAWLTTTDFTQED